MRCLKRRAVAKQTVFNFCGRQTRIGVRQLRRIYRGLGEAQ
jgi:hypothetical protein